MSVAYTIRYYTGVLCHIEAPIAEITPVKPVCSRSVAVTVRLSRVGAAICNGADVATVKTVLQFLKSC
jgi:hypothetical protein